MNHVAKLLKSHSAAELIFISFWMLVLFFGLGITGLSSLRMLGLLPSGWPPLWMALPLAILTYLVPWIILTTSGLERRLDPEDPETAGLAFAAVPMFLLAAPLLLDHIGDELVRRAGWAHVFSEDWSN